ncbi:MAG: glycosyltransferase [Nitrospiraceae bacterium]|nr:glycosyltransferase [Nitrospiraceae bacterium]
MRIAFIITEFPSLAETFILNQITGLIDQGHDISIFAEQLEPEPKVHPDIEKYDLLKRTRYFRIIPGSKFRRLMEGFFLFSKGLYKSPGFLLKLAAMFFKSGRKCAPLEKLYLSSIFFGLRPFDIVHCHFGPNGNLGVMLRKIGVVKGKIVTSFHGYDANSLPLKHRGVYDELFLTGDLFTTNTNFTASQIIALGCDRDKIALLPVGLRIERFRFQEKSISPGEKIKLLTVARLAEKKGHEYAIRALAKVISRHKNIIYLVAGDGPLRIKLEALALEAGVKDHIEFLHAVEEKEVLRLYEEAHIFVLPSITARNGDREGQGLVLQEAQAAGLPVISTLHNGIPDGVLDGKSGFLVPEKDAEALAGKIEYLIEHPGLWPEMGRQGRRFVEEKYDINKLNQKLVGIYETLLRRET